MVTGLHHISIISSAEASVGFYTRLGFKETERIQRGYDTVVLMEGCGFGLEIFIDPRHCAKDGEPLGLRNISMTVDDIETAAGTFGAEVKTDWHGKRYLIIKDPDGILIQLHE